MISESIMTYDWVKPGSQLAVSCRVERSLIISTTGTEWYQLADHIVTCVSYVQE